MIWNSTEFLIEISSLFYLVFGAIQNFKILFRDIFADNFIVQDNVTVYLSIG